MFTWDPAKARTNLAKHGIAFDDALVALSDPEAIQGDDPNAEEPRHVATGTDALGRIVTVVYTYRGDQVRLISARRATRRERRRYAGRL